LPAANLEEVIAILTREYQDARPGSPPAVETRPVTLDGVESTYVRIGRMDSWARSVVIFRDGRAVVIGWTLGSDQAGTGYFGDLLETLRFVD
jgi:hypothetical protein